MMWDFGIYHDWVFRVMESGENIFSYDESSGKTFYQEIEQFNKQTFKKTVEIKFKKPIFLKWNKESSQSQKKGDKNI